MNIFNQIHGMNLSWNSCSDNTCNSLAKNKISSPQNDPKI